MATKQGTNKVSVSDVMTMMKQLADGQASLLKRLDAIESGKAKAEPKSKAKAEPKKNEGSKSFQWEYRKRGTYTYIRCDKKPLKEMTDKVHETFGGRYSGYMGYWRFDHVIDPAHIVTIFGSEPKTKRAVEYVRGEKEFDLGWTLEVIK